MSFLGSTLLTPRAGDALDATVIMPALDALAALQRTFIADAVGPAWLGGMQAQSTDIPQQIGLSVAAGVVVPYEAGQPAGGATGLGLSARSRQPVSRDLYLTPNSNQVVIARPEGADETIVILETLTEAAVVPQGATALTLVSTDFERIAAQLDMRVLPWMPLRSKAASATILSATEWQELSDARLAVLLEAGDTVLVGFFAHVTNNGDKKTQPYPEVQFMLHDSTPDTDYQPQPAFTGTNLKALFGTTSNTKHGLVWHGLYAPITADGSPAAGVHLLGMHARAANANVDDAVLTAQVLRADRAAS